MSWKIPNGIEKEYLESSKLCDLNHPTIKENAVKITKGSETPKDAAIKIFYFVRDKIPLAIVNPWKTASETLEMGKGSCLTKATLQSALLRAVGIPARFRIIEFKGKDPKEWEGIMPSTSLSMMPERWPHYFTEVYIDGKWIKADATFDNALIPDTEDWNGEENICSIEYETILSDKGTFASIEEGAKELDEKYKEMTFLTMNGYKFFWIVNLYQRMQRFKNKLR
jgi:hypothetical protein